MPLLPHDDDIAAAVARLPPADLARYNAYYSTAPDGGPPGGGYVTGGAGGEAAQMELSAALDRALEAATTGGVSGLDLVGTVR